MIDTIDNTFFRTVFNTATEGWIVTNKVGDIVMTNPRLLEMFKYDSSDLIGKKVEVLMPKEARGIHISHRADYTKSPRKRPHGIGIEVMGLRKDNSTFPVDISLNYSLFEDNFYALAVITDITIRKEKEQQLQKSLLKQEKLEAEKLRNEIRVLKNQLNPHYLFNSLSVLSPLINIDKVKSTLFLNKLINTYRYLLEIKDKNKVSLSEEIKFLEDYLFLQKVRFDEKFDTNISINNEDLDKCIIPLSIQVLVENIFKHNALYTDKKLMIDIRSSNDGIKVTNNVIKKYDSKIESFGIGLKNIEKQYSFFSENKPIFERSDHQFSAWLPLIKDKN